MTTNKLESTNSLDLQTFEEFGNEISARGGFEATVLKCNGESGEWTAGKKNTPMNGKKLVADINTDDGVSAMRDVAVGRTGNVHAVGGIVA